MPGVSVTSLDPEEFDVLPVRRRTSRPGSLRDRQVADAYDFVRARLNLGAPVVPSDQSALGAPHHPGWAVRRAFARLVKDGVLLGPVPVPKTENGRPAQYHYSFSRTALTRNTNVMWAEGAWRETYWFFPEHRIREKANVPRKMARRTNKTAARKHEFETAQTRSNSVFKGIHPASKRTVEVPIIPMSMRARIREFFRGLKVVDWDGMAYVPVPGPALDAVLAWRASLPVVGAAPSVKEEPKEEKRKTCRRCGVSFPLSFWKHKRTHALGECNVLLATRIMTE